MQAGYSMEAIIGQPGRLKCGNHTQDFYDQMWSSVENTGEWKGEVFNKDPSKPLPVPEMKSYMEKTGILHHRVVLDPGVLLKNTQINGAGLEQV